MALKTAFVALTILNSDQLSGRSSIIWSFTAITFVCAQEAGIL